jgi:hypothetical protein
MARHRTKAWPRNASVFRDQRIALDLFNPQVSARIAAVSTAGRSSIRHAGAALERIRDTQGLTRMSIVPKD